MKTKGLEIEFRENEAENMLKISLLVNGLIPMNLADKMCGYAGGRGAETLPLLAALRGILSKGLQGDTNDSQLGSNNYRLQVG